MHGSSPSVSVIGYLLAAGLSFYGRAHGLACNHVLGFEVVTSDRQARHVDATSEPDLFYALRGGGGGYGVVTEAEIELLPYPEVTAGSMFFSVDKAGHCCAPAATGAGTRASRSPPPSAFCLTGRPSLSLMHAILTARRGGESAAPQRSR
jgi:FAD/FMN-containing dehydrogenase